MHDDHIVIDYLLEVLNKHGSSQFDVSKELEVRYGKDFAIKLSAFYERALEYYDVAKKNPKYGLIELTPKGKEALIRGGWLASKQLDDIESEEAFKREVVRRDNEAKAEELYDKAMLQRTQNMSVVALVLAISSIILSVANFILAE